jgi:hypothetical protein
VTGSTSPSPSCSRLGPGSHGAVDRGGLHGGEAHQTPLYGDDAVNQIGLYRISRLKPPGTGGVGLRVQFLGFVREHDGARPGGLIRLFTVVK